MLKIITSIFVLCIGLVSTNIVASPAPTIIEKDRLIAFSDKTYTVIVEQNQVLFYRSSVNRLLLRIIDISTNKFISEILISSTITDHGMDEPFVTTYSITPDEPQVIGNIMLHPQKLYDNLEYPKDSYQIDSEGVYLNKKDRADLLDFATIKSRFLEKGNSSGPYSGVREDESYALKKSNASKVLTFIGGYRVSIKEREFHFIVLKLGSSEHVFSVPSKKD